MTCHAVARVALEKKVIVECQQGQPRGNGMVQWMSRELHNRAHYKATQFQSLWQEWGGDQQCLVVRLLARLSMEGRMEVAGGQNQRKHYYCMQMSTVEVVVELCLLQGRLEVACVHQQV